MARRETAGPVTEREQVQVRQAARAGMSVAHLLLIIYIFVVHNNTFLSSGGIAKENSDGPRRTEEAKTSRSRTVFLCLLTYLLHYTVYIQDNYVIYIIY